MRVFETSIRAMSVPSIFSMIQLKEFLKACGLSTAEAKLVSRLLEADSEMENKI